MINRLIFTRYVCVLFFISSACDIQAQSTPFHIDSINSLLINNYLYASRQDKEKFAKKIVKQKIPFDQVYSRLKKGKEYSRKVQIGFVENTFVNRQGIEHDNLIFIPYKYNPEKRYQVKVFLHGAVTNLNPRQIYNGINFSDTAWRSVNTISIYPSGHLGSQRWGYSQIENINQLIDFVKSNYNIDENNVYMTGISDGGSGIYYQSNVNSTYFSCYLPYIGSMSMLGFVKNKQFYLNNFKGLPFFIVNTKNDQIFNIDVVTSYIDAMKKVVDDVTYFVIDTSGHSTQWYPALKDTIRAFINSHKRNPFPADIYFSTENPDTINRKFWVRILKLGRVKNESALEDYNLSSNNTGLLFPRRKPFGQIEVHKKRNEVEVKTTNVKKYSLLLSPDDFDFSIPVKIYTNGELSYEGSIPKNVETLLKYNIIDNDRTMLYGVEIEITVGKKLEPL